MISYSVYAQLVCLRAKRYKVFYISGFFLTSGLKPKCVFPISSLLIFYLTAKFLIIIANIEQITTIILLQNDEKKQAICTFQLRA